MEYPRIIPKRLSGTEELHDDGAGVGTTVLDFWRWSGSNLVSNAFRGGLAEFIVASALGAADDVRGEWEAWDLLTKDGLRVEIKASAYIQSWAQKRLSTPRFSIGRAIAWDPETDTWGNETKRHADVYVFCLHAHKEQESLDPLDLSQWRFFVLSTAVLDGLGDQKSLGLGTLRKLRAAEVDYSGLRGAIAATVGHLGLDVR
jgi:hypothetical protein